MNDDALQINSCDRLGTRTTNDPDRRLAFVLGDRRGGDDCCRRFADLPFDDERGGRAQRQRTRRDRLQAGAKGSRLRCRLRRQFPQRDLERLLGRASEPRLVSRRLERRETIFRHVGHDLGLAFVGDRDDRLPFGHDLTDLDAYRGDDTALRRAQHRVLQPIACKLEFPLLGLGRCRRRLRTALRLLVVGYAHRAVALQRVEPVAIRLGLARLRRGGDELLARRFLGQPVIGVVEHRQARRPRALSGRRRLCAARPCRRREMPRSLRDAPARCRRSGPFPAPCRSGSRRCARHEALQGAASMSTRTGRRRRSPRRRLMRGRETDSRWFLVAIDGVS